MNSFVSLSLFYLLVAFAAEVSPAKLGFCTTADLQIRINEYVRLDPYRCEVRVCNEDAVWETHTCDEQIPTPGYKFGNLVDVTAHFPDCCKREEIKISPATTSYIFEVQCPI